MSDFVVIKKHEQYISRWIRLVERTVDAPFFDSPQVYHSLKQADYVHVLAVTEDGRVPIVRQYRPCLERYTLELPGGLVDEGEEPAEAAARELFEETGYEAKDNLVSLARLAPDTGRLENCLWAYLASDVVFNPGAWQPEDGIEVVLMTRGELFGALIDGSFDAALNVASIGLAMLSGRFSFGDANEGNGQTVKG